MWVIAGRWWFQPPGSRGHRRTRERETAGSGETNGNPDRQRYTQRFPAPILIATSLQNTRPSSGTARLHMAPHPFAKKSHAEQLSSLRPEEIWPINTVSWDASADHLILGVRHHEAGTDVKAVRATEQMLSSTALWWATVTGGLQPLDQKLLTERDPTHYWGSYQDCMTVLVEHLQGSSPEGIERRKMDLHLLASTAVSEYHQELRSVTADTFLQILAGDQENLRPEHKVPLVHWLSAWAARQQGRILACSLDRNPATNLPAQCPLDRKAWNSEIKGRAPSLSYPGIMARLVVSVSEAAEASGPLWLNMLTSPAQGTSVQEYAISLDRLSIVPDMQVQTVASAVRLMLHELRVPDSVATMLKTHLMTSQALVGAVRAVWQSCPTQHQPQVRVNIDKIIAALEQEHGSCKMDQFRQAALVKVQDQLRRTGGRTDQFWALQASGLVSKGVVPAGSMAGMFAVSDLVTYRAAISQTVQQVMTSKELDGLVREVTAGLRPEEPSPFDWFERGSDGVATADATKAPRTPPRREVRSQSGDLTSRTLQSPPSPTTGLLPPSPAGDGSVIRIRGLKEAREPVQVSAALTHLLGVQVIVTQLDINTGMKYVCVSAAKYAELFSSAPMRRYYSREFDWTLELESKQQSGDPFHLPLLSPNTAAQKGATKRKAAGGPKKAKKRKVGEPSPVAPSSLTPSTPPLLPHPPASRSTSGISTWDQPSSRAHIRDSPLPGRQKY